MKKIILMGLMGTALLSACSGIGLNIGTSIIPGIYIGTSGTLDKDDFKLKQNASKEEIKEKVKKEEIK